MLVECEESFHTIHYGVLGQFIHWSASTTELAIYGGESLTKTNPRNDFFLTQI